MTNSNAVKFFINKIEFSVEDVNQTGKSLKELASIPSSHSLRGGECRSCGDDSEISDDQQVILENGQHFWSAKAGFGVEVTVNGAKYCFQSPRQTGLEIKTKAGIRVDDVLFREMPSEDEVIPNEAEITLHCDDVFHSSPPANYGDVELSREDVGSGQFECFLQQDEWTFLVLDNYALPSGYSHDAAQLLVKLPPGFPDAAPDMFWLKPHITTKSGCVPQGTSSEVILGESWQRFSWHLQPGAWRPGISTLRDYMRCIKARLERRN